MNMVFLLLLLSGLGEAALPPPASAQARELRLEELVASARSHNPRGLERELRGAITERRLTNLDTRKRPELTFQGQAAYHSAVPEIPGGFAASPPKDQYGVSVDLQQLLWDGGRTEQQKAIEQAAGELDQQAVETVFQHRREQLEAAFFEALSNQLELDLVASFTTDLEAQREVMAARVRAGTALPGDTAVLSAELEGLLQRHLQAAATRRAALDLLSLLTGEPIPPEVRLVVPAPAAPGDLLAAAQAAVDGARVERSEVTEFDLARRLLQEQLELVGLAKKPMISSFAQGGYGRPADLDFFERDPKPYIVAGVRVRWQPIDWGVHQREQEILALQGGISRAREAALLESISATLLPLARQIEALDAVLASDDRIVELRQRVSRQVAAQLREGVITSTTYLTERSAEHRARLARDQHRLARAQSLVQFSTALGDSR